VCDGAPCSHDAIQRGEGKKATPRRRCMGLRLCLFNSKICFLAADESLTVLAMNSGVATTAL
jgi:hypothetical protein